LELGATDPLAETMSPVMTDACPAQVEAERPFGKRDRRAAMDVRHAGLDELAELEVLPVPQPCVARRPIRRRPEMARR
jgi:hypothetical protein